MAPEASSPSPLDLCPHSSLSSVLHCLHLLQALSFPTLVSHSSCLFLLKFSPHLFPLNLSEHIFSKTQTSEDLKAKSLISYTPWLMLNCEPQAKIFFKVIKCSHRLADESNIIIHIYRPGFSDLHQLVCMLVGKTTPSTGWKSLIQSNPINPLE